jgi:6-phosphogluconolactonase
MMNIVRFATTEEFVRSAVTWISGVIAETASSQETVRIGLCGGSTPIPVYTMLATDKNLPWEKTTFFLLDERYVARDNADSNQRMIRDTLLTRQGARAHFIAPDTTLTLDASVDEYTQQLKDYAKPDLVIIGMGDDGHIVSLFPPLPPEAFGLNTVLKTQTNAYAVRDRISVGFPILLQSSRRLFLISGEKKRALLKKMQSESEDVSLYPAQYLFDDRSTWFVGP